MMPTRATMQQIELTSYSTSTLDAIQYFMRCKVRELGASALHHCQKAERYPSLLADARKKIAFEESQVAGFLEDIATLLSSEIKRRDKERRP